MLYLAIIALAVALVVVVLVGRRIMILEKMEERLAASVGPSGGTAGRLSGSVSAEDHPSARIAIPRYQWIPWVVGLLAVGTLLLFNIPVILSVAFGFVVALLGAQLEAHLAERRAAKLEAQLADAIDLMVSSLTSGANVIAALENAVRESRQPLRHQLEELTGRIRLGDDPEGALRAFRRNVPLETFHLFATTLSVHWEVGGNLGPTLSTVSRTIRDRQEVSRRIRSTTAQARVSTVAVILLTYFIFYLMYTNDPDRAMGFATSTAGIYLITGAVVLHAVGIVWQAAISKPRF